MEPLQVGTLFAGRFHIRKMLGIGGMGVVYLADHDVLRRAVALKVVLPHLLADLNAMGRFRREARAACRVIHPHITQVYDFGYSEDGVPYLVMEYVEGPTLQHALMQDGPLPVARALRVLHQIARALTAAHEADVVHRDLKPLNIVLTAFEGQPDWVKILDFGLAKILGPEATRSLSAQGVLFGTPEYMSPDQIEGADVDYRSDHYSFGVLAFELLVGRAPFEGTPLEIMASHLNATPPPPSQASGRAEIPRALDDIVLRCLAKRPEQRYDRPAALEEAIAAVVEAESSRQLARAATMIDLE